MSRDAVRRAVARWRPGASVRFRRSRYATSAGVENVFAACDGERFRLVYKCPAKSVRPRFLTAAGREAELYRSGIPDMLDAPRLLAGGPEWLLLDWAGSVDLGQVGDRRVWAEAARRLGAFHAWAESETHRLARSSPVRWDDPGLHLRWARRARMFSPDPALALLWRRYGEVAGAMADLPRTVLHGDCNASNVLVTRRPGLPARTRFIDWEVAGVGPGLLDLAALVSGAWSDRDRTRLVEAYRAGHGSSGHGFEQALQLCRLALAVQWLGWSASWAPPARLAHDWRGEALSLAAGLGLVDRAA